MDPNDREDITSCFLKTETFIGTVRALGFDGHPEFRELSLKNRGAVHKHSEDDWKKLEDIVYRQDIENKYQDHRAARLHHLREVAKYDITMPPPKPTTADALLLRNTLANFHTVHKEFHTCFCAVG